MEGKKLLFSEKYSDLEFNWDDGTTIPAHRCKVFANSKYFEYEKNDILPCSHCLI